MRVEEFFKDEIVIEEGWNFRDTGLDVDLLRTIRRGPLAGHGDAEVALGLTQLIRREFTAYGTDAEGLRIGDAESREAMRTLETVIRRLGIGLDVPFRDFPTFHSYWSQHGGYGSWQARRDMIHELFEPLQIKLEQMEDAGLAGELVDPITPAQRLGWPAVDIEITELRRHFHAAATVQDYRNIGNDCIAVLEALSATVYDPALHLRNGETEPSVPQTKQRLDRYADMALPGAGNAEIRALVKKTIEFAQAVKHNPDGTRVRAGIAADAVIQLANMLRRLSDAASPPAG